MDFIFLVNYTGANSDQVAQIKAILLAFSRGQEILHSIEDEQFLVYFPDGLNKLKNEVLGRERSYPNTTITQVYKENFHQSDIINFFDKFR